MSHTNENFAKLNGTKFYYEVAGGGHPLVLVHAGIADCSMWDEQFQVFAQHYQVIRYDMRGYGQTALVDGPLVDGPYAHYQDLNALLDFLGVEQAHVLGCSLGGTTTLDFALAYPERVSSLIAVACRPEGYTFQSATPPQFAAMEVAFAAGDFEQLSELEVQMWVDGPTRTPDQVDARLRDRVRRMNVVALKNEALELGQPQPLDPPAAQRLSEIAAPTLVIIGALDRPVMLSAADFMTETIPNVRKVVIEGTAHLPSMEKPAVFNQAGLDFLGSLPTGN
ncbi:MAG: alpha/beta hydrolase [Caldilineaceae bacterium]